ncbi:MAG: maleylacetoacetate isomerase [Burkholderiaceae bacterium]|nr:MAG: maleylacetoacetate isomerase [Burkholderiaceae bacterium]MBE7427067.1 maleylacetoacetate isomerase [Ideonella sp.]MCC7288530.1 maleylacetoacetate isomerase [Burkholderiaceae bacterium]
MSEHPSSTGDAAGTRQAPPLALYTYFRSSAAYRVRIALNLKALPYEAIPVHLLRGGGEQRQGAHLARNPQALVPVLHTEDGWLTQSMAIVEWLDEAHPSPPLLPADRGGRARVRAIAQAIACDIHPLANLRVLQYLGGELGIDEPRKNAWSRHWVDSGLAAVERLLADDPRSGRFCHGDAPTLADCCLVPQVFNARRVGARLDDKPAIARIVAACEALDAFRRAAPANQPDAE